MLISLTSFFFACSNETPKQQMEKATEPLAESKETDSKKIDSNRANKLQTQSVTIFGQLPDKMPGSEKDTPDRIALGKALYFEKA